MADKQTLYQAVTSGKILPELEISKEDLDGLDLVAVSDEIMHVLQGSQGHLVKLLHADYKNREFRVSVDGREISIHLRNRVEARVHAMGFDLNKNQAKLKQITSPMPGLVLNILANQGDTVTEGQPVIVLEAMKMENVLNAPSDGTIGEILVEPGKNVDKGQVLITLE